MAFKMAGSLRMLLLLLLAAVPALLIGLQEPPPAARGVRVVDVVARVPEAGGFQPDSINVYAGQRVRLRFQADDVAHGVAIGPGLGIDLGDLAPGEVKVVDVTFDQTGTYTFYCNKWCSPHHWRMRGVIAVTHPRVPAPTPQRDPVIDGLAAEGIDIDAYLVARSGEIGAAHGGTGHTAAGVGDGTPVQDTRTPPSAAAGAIRVAGLLVPPELEDAAWRRRHTPLEGEARLAAANPSADAAAVADVAAYLWLGGAQAAPPWTGAQPPPYTPRTAPPVMAIRATGRGLTPARPLSHHRRSTMPNGWQCAGATCSTPRSAAAAWARACPTLARSSAPRKPGHWWTISGAWPTSADRRWRCRRVSRSSLAGVRTRFSGAPIAAPAGASAR